MDFSIPHDAKAFSEPLESTQLASSSAPSKGNPAPQTTSAKVHENYSELPLSFEANVGQTDARVQYLSRGPNYTLFLTATEAVTVLSQPGPAGPAGRAVSGEPMTVTPTVIRMQIVGGSQAPQITGQDELPGKANYFLGRDPAGWHANVPTFERVEYQNVYPGINLAYYGNQGQLEYDFVVAPGADPHAITLNFAGADRLEIDSHGDLVLHCGGQNLLQHRPVLYQEVNGRRQEIAGTFVFSGSHQVGFQIGSYDASRPLVIDPVLSYSTFLGGSDFDDAHGIAVDAAGNAYVTGQTSSLDFPTENPTQPTYGGLGDAFVAKLDPSGTALAYSTYLGGSGVDFGSGIAVDGVGDAYVAGATLSTDFPTVNPLQPQNRGGFDAFITALNATGDALLYSTYLGGSGDDLAFAIALDGAGAAYVTGRTSGNWPTVQPLQAVYGGGSSDAFLAKIGPLGRPLVYSTYLGGSNEDSAYGIAVDLLGNAYITGETASFNFPTANPFQGGFAGGALDAFITKVNSAGSALVYSTYLGGNDIDQGFGIAVDATGDAYVTGRTSSASFPTHNAFQASYGGGFSDAFLTELDASGIRLAFSTFLGGSAMDEGLGITVNESGSVYVVGETGSPNFPTANAIQSSYAGGGSDAFVAQFSADPEGFRLVYSTYLGGSGYDRAYSIAVDATGNAYLTGYAESPDFPTVNPFQGNFGGLQDGFVAKIGSRPPVVDCSVNSPMLWPPNHRLVNVGLTINVTAGDDPDPALQIQVFGNDNAGSSDAQDIAPDTLKLRAERTGNGNGRVYLIVAQATDATGALALDVCPVVVPHDQSRRAVETIRAEATAAEAWYRSFQTAPPGFSLLGEEHTG